MQQQIGRFRILSQKGSGGMGVIMLGEDEALGRKAAIKLLGPDRLHDPKAEARFRREATAAARLKHPNIAALYEMGEHDNKPFLAIEWVEGQSLEDVLLQGPLPVERAMRIIEQVLLTLDYAHSQGVVHRDVKPANLMISGQDHVTLVDFGLAFLLSEPGLTSTGVLFGTPLYLAPEMAGEEDVDGRADLYSSALVFFEMLTGSPPFDPAPPAELISQHLHAPRPILTERKPDLPAALDPVLQKAMAVDPRDRYPTGGALLLALRQAIGSAPPPPPPSRIWPFIASGLALLAIGLWVFDPRDQPPAPSRRPRVIVAATASPLEWGQYGGGAGRNFQMYGALKEPQARWQQPEPQAESVVVAENKLVVSGPRGVEVREAQTGDLLWQADQAGTALLYTWSDPSLVVLNQGKVWRALQLTDGKEVWKRELPASGPGGVLADDGYVYAGAGTALVSIDPSDGSIAFTVELGEPVTLIPVARSAGAFVALETRVVAVDSFSEKVVWSWKAPARPTALALTPDDTVLAGCQDGSLSSLPLLSGEPNFTAETGEQMAGFAAVSGVAASLGVKGKVTLYSMPGGGDEPLWKINLDQEPAGPPLTDGKQVLVATKSGELLSLQGGLVTWRLKLEGECRSTPVPAGDWLYVLAGGRLSAYSP